MRFPWISRLDEKRVAGGPLREIFTMREAGAVTNGTTRGKSLTLITKALTGTDLVMWELYEREERRAPPDFLASAFAESPAIAR